MGERMILIVCPTCGKQRKIPVPEEQIMSKETGTTSLLIPANMVCEHQYHAYVDKNFAVRDYLTVDFSKQNQSTENIKKAILNTIDPNKIDLDMLGEYFDIEDFRKILFAGFLGVPIILLEEDFENPILKYIFYILSKLMPETQESTLFMNPNNYLKFPEAKVYFVYNVKQKLLVRRPYTGSESEIFAPVCAKLRTGKSFKVQIVKVKNWIDHVKRISELPEIQELIEGKTTHKKVIKKLLKNEPAHSDKLTMEFIEVMEKRAKIKKQYS